MKRLTITGNTYKIKDTLKAEGFRWNPNNKTWSQTFEDDDEMLIKFADLYDSEGFTTTVTTASDSNERKYFIKEGWIFNLEAMHDKLWCIEYDIREGELQFPLTIAGKAIRNWDDLENLREEAQNLESIAKSGKVTGKQYGRIREIITWRIEQRYTTCLAAGMDEKDAAGCFEDL